MSKILLSLLGLLSLILSSCSGPRDSQLATLQTQFGVEVSDSCGILQAATASYLKNVQPPLGVKAVVYAVDSIPMSALGTYADEVFDRYTEKQYSGNSFGDRGVLIVASSHPQLIQIRVGHKYEVYCRMHGSTAGQRYLMLQQQTRDTGIDKMLPVALDNTLADIRETRDLNYLQRVGLTFSIAHIELFLEDLATPSQSFFSQFYFQPFTKLVAWCYGLCGSWWLAFLLIIGLYCLAKYFMKKAIDSLYYLFAGKDNNSNEDHFYSETIRELCSRIIIKLLSLVVAVPTFAAISLLSSSRTEDLLVMAEYHIPATDLLQNTEHVLGLAPSLWILVMMIAAYYLRYCLKNVALIILSATPLERQYAMMSVSYLGDTYRKAANFTYKRMILSLLFKELFMALTKNIFSHQAHEGEQMDVDAGDNTGDTDNKPKRQAIDMLFYTSDSQYFQRYPFLALSVNIHREGLCFAFLLSIIVSVMMTNVYALYFTLLWIAEGIVSLWESQVVYDNVKKFALDFSPFIHKAMKEALVVLLICLPLMWLLKPDYTQRPLDEVQEVALSLPRDISGRYLLDVMDGKESDGATARLVLDEENGDYIMSIFSDRPIVDYRVQYDPATGMLTNDVLGTGTLEYNNVTKSKTINFGNRWILKN